MKIAIFPGTFNPFTIGHADILRRGLELFDRVVVSVGMNIDKPEMQQDAADRAEAIRALYASERRVQVVCWSGLTIDLCRKVGARFILRGVRSVKDYEYERDIADANMRVGGIDTVMIAASPELACISSSLIRDLRSHGYDISEFLPQPPPDQE